MYLEERVSTLEEENRALRERIDRLERDRTTRYVTAKELAELMGCSVQNVHKKIRTGDIVVTRKLGDPRIPMSQFLISDPPKNPVIKSAASPQREKTMADLVFGS